MSREQLTAQLRIRRSDGTDSGYFVDYNLQYTDGASVLDGLISIRDEQNASLAVRFSCLNANVCKECLMQVNGAVQYACIAKLEPGLTTLEPLPGKRVLRDLVTETVPARERLETAMDEVQP